MIWILLTSLNNLNHSYVHIFPFFFVHTLEVLVCLFSFIFHLSLDFLPLFSVVLLLVNCARVCAHQWRMLHSVFHTHNALQSILGAQASVYVVLRFFIAGDLKITANLLSLPLLFLPRICHNNWRLVCSQWVKVDSKILMLVYKNGHQGDGKRFLNRKSIVKRIKLGDWMRNHKMRWRNKKKWKKKIEIRKKSNKHSENRKINWLYDINVDEKTFTRNEKMEKFKTKSKLNEKMQMQDKKCKMFNWFAGANSSQNYQRIIHDKSLRSKYVRFCDKEIFMHSMQSWNVPVSFFLNKEKLRLFFTINPFCCFISSLASSHALAHPGRKRVIRFSLSVCARAKSIQF